MDYVKDESGNIIQKIEDGKVIESHRRIDGNKISEKSKEQIRNAVNNQNWESAFKQLYEILTGEEI